jgi:hypothetical protein
VGLAVSREGFVEPGQDKVVRPCRIHPHIRAVVDMHNLRRDEHLNLCGGCFLMWLRKASFDVGVTNALTGALGEVEPFASEVAAQWAAEKREDAYPGRPWRVARSAE